VPRPKLPPGPGRPKGSLNKATREIRDFARSVLESPEYVESLKRRLRQGNAPHMETLLHHYAYGKPRDTLEITGPVEPLRIVIAGAEDA
jgi:hypothetical protein